MNDHILAGQWKQMKGALKSWWSDLSDLTAIVRKYPIQSVLISLGVGIWLARGGKR